MQNAALLLRPPTWTRSAACAGMVTPDEDHWHPREDLSPKATALQYALGRRICAGCPVRYDCAVDALRGAIAHGMYGGLTPTDRRQLARRHGYPQPGASQHGTYARYVSCTDGPDARPCEACREAKRRYMEDQRAQRGGDPHRLARRSTALELVA